MITQFTSGFVSLPKLPVTCPPLLQMTSSQRHDSFLWFLNPSPPRITGALVARNGDPTVGLASSRLLWGTSWPLPHGMFWLWFCSGLGSGGSPWGEGESWALWAVPTPALYPSSHLERSLRPGHPWPCIWLDICPQPASLSQGNMLSSFSE